MDVSPRGSLGVGYENVKRRVRVLRRKFLEPLSQDEDLRRREYILNIILAASIVMMVVLDAMVLYRSLREGTTAASISFVAFSIFPAFFLFLYALSRRGYFVLASYLLVAAYFIGNSYAVYAWGANLPTAILGYALLIVIGSILISTRFGFWLAGLVAIYLLPAWYAQLHGFIIPADVQVLSFGDGVALAVLYLLIAVIAWLSNREMEKSLVRARVSEWALKEERDLLEEKVDERTSELRAAQLEKIDHLYRFAEFGQLASGLFHDLTSILSALSLQIENGQTGGDPAASLKSAFGVQDEINRFTEAVRKQLKREDVREIFSLTDGIKDAIQLLTHTCNVEHIRLSFEPVPAQGFLYFGNPVKFHQIIVNVLMNAIESFENIPRGSAAGRKIAIKLAIDDGVAIDIKDNGCGIPEAFREKVFEPFFTTKQGSQGVGIGLAITKHVIEKDFGGTIEMTGAEGGGSVFKIRFPIYYGPKADMSGDRGRDHGD